jgi:CRP/FNR family transcriptional regulator, cyclic AMP receptor protein
MTISSEHSNKLSYLSMVEIFQDLSKSEIEYIGQLTAMVTTPKGRVFYNPTDRSEVLFILKKGDVSIYRISPEGKKLVTVQLGPGSIFGEMTVLGQRMQETYAEAVSECLICVMSRSDVEQLFLKDPRIAMRLAQSLGNRLAEAEARLEDMAFKSVPGRVAGLLLRLADDTDWRGRKVVSGLTHQQLAEIVGSYRETVTLTLNDFRAAGYVDIGRRKVIILNETELSRVAES